MFQDETGDFGNHPRTETGYGLSQQAFKVASGVLQAMKGAFNALPDMTQQTVKGGGVLLGFAIPFIRPDAISGRLAAFSVPSRAPQTPITKNVSVTHPM